MSKLQAVVANWYPRFLANGIDWFDLTRTLDGVADWDDWADAWTDTADRYEALGRAALDEGHRVTAAEHLRRAALTLQFAQFVLTEDPKRRAALQARMSALYARAAPLLDPPARAVSIAYGEGCTVVGYLRRADRRAAARARGAAAGPGVHQGAVQHLRAVLPPPRRRDPVGRGAGPGRGLAVLPVPLRPVRRGDGRGRAGDRRTGRCRRARVVVVGTSFGGHLALAHAAAFPGLRGVVDIAGPYDLRAFDELQEVTREGFRDFVGAADQAEARELLSDVTLDGVLERLEQPVLVVHGERDTIIRIEHAHRIAAALGDRATVRLEPEGNHSCNNLATVVRPVVADWVTDRLETAHD